jgi:hypothetical protein
MSTFFVLDQGFLKVAVRRYSVRPRHTYLYSKLHYLKTSGFTILGGRSP